MKNKVMIVLEYADLKKLVKEAIQESNLENGKNSAKQDDELITQNEAVKFCRTTKPTFIKWRKEGLFPYYGNGGRYLYKKSELLEAMKQYKRLNA